MKVNDLKGGTGNDGFPNNRRRFLSGAALGLGALAGGPSPFAQGSAEDGTANCVHEREGEPLEPVLEPDLPIVDAHHHLWIRDKKAMQKAIAAIPPDNPLSKMGRVRGTYRYLYSDFLEDIQSGHNIQASVFLDSRSMYRKHGPEPLRSVGEVEFASGVAAMAESGNFGTAKVCAGIISDADLTLGEAVEEVLLAHIRAGGGRFRSVHLNANFDPDPALSGWAKPGLLYDRQFRAGYKLLHKYGLSFDALVWEPQLPEVVDLARSFPQTQIILNHLGMPLGIGGYAKRRQERFPIWRGNLKTLAGCPNVVVKIGALGAQYAGFPSFMSDPQENSQTLAAQWTPYIETCIEIFGASRCMFESNFPVDAATCSYRVLWNAFKRIVSGASSEEKAALFSGTAIRAYGLNI